MTANLTQRIHDPEDTGKSGLSPQQAIARAMDAFVNRIPFAQICAEYGDYAAHSAKNTWARVHTTQHERLAVAINTLTYEANYAPEPKDRIAAAKGLADAVYRGQAMNYGNERLLTSSRMRERALDNLRRPDRTFRSLLLEAWGRETPRPPIDDLISQLLDNWEDVIRAKGWVRPGETAPSYVEDSESPDFDADG